jgi:predicted O-methyltransferase YrrM
MTKRPRDDPFTVLDDARVASVLRRLYSEATRQHLSIIRHFLPHALSFLRQRFMPFSESEMGGFYADKYIAIVEDQGAFCYLTARTLRARTIVEFGTSFGLSMLWLAAPSAPMAAAAS